MVILLQKKNFGPNVIYFVLGYMYYMYVKLRGQVALRGQKVHGKCEQRVQGRMQIFEKMSQMALNHDLRPELESRGKMLQIALNIMDLGAFCVEQ